MLKKLYLTILFVLMISLLAGCSGGSYSISSGDVKASGNSISGSYKSFSGHYFKTVKFEEGQTVVFSLSVNTMGGELTARVMDSEGNTVAELTGNDSVKIQKSGKYKVQVETQKHQGGFMLSWK